MIKGLPIIYGNKGGHGGFSNGPLMDEDRINRLWSLIIYSKNQISQLTPRELIRIFPIEKKYNGKKHQTKDYFSTVEAIEAIGMDKVIGDNVNDLLFDYQNRHIFDFMVLRVGVYSDLLKRQGHEDPFETFLAENGVKSMQLITDGDGKQFLYDPVKSTTMPVRKRRPRYLRVV